MATPAITSEASTSTPTLVSFAISARGQELAQRRVRGRARFLGRADEANATLVEEGEAVGSLGFETRSGLLTALRRGDDLIGLDFPADPPAPVEPPAGLTEVLGAKLVSVHQGRFDLLVEVADAETVRALAPDIRALATLPVRGVIVTAAGDKWIDVQLPDGTTKRLAQKPK